MEALVMETRQRGPLSEIRVLDLTRYIAGPLCGQMLADAGAEVIKIEPPGGEISRHEPPLVQVDENHATSLLFLRFNRGKKSVVIDTRTEGGRETLRELIRSADVLIENFRPGVLESWGLSWEAIQSINPRLIYATTSGFGYENSPMRDRAAFNTVAEALGGLVSRQPTEELPPLSMGVLAADNISGLYSVIGILQALISRTSTGVGQRVDISMHDSVLAFNNENISNASVIAGSGERPPDMVLAPFGYY